MRYGCSINQPGQARLLLANGYDYIEMNLCALAALPEAEFAAFRDEVGGMPIKIEVFNLLLPLSGEIQIVGEGVDVARQEAYLSAAFARAAQMGAELMVFGSARARAVPEGYPPEKARRQLVEFVRRMMLHARRHGITMVVEPVCSREVQGDRIKTLPDAIELAREVGDEHLFALCDLFHMHHENEPMQNIVAAGAWIKHAHISGVTEERRYPAPGDGFDYAPFFAALKAIGYDNRLSLECFDPDMENGLGKSKALLEAYTTHT